ncbi:MULTISPECIES: hypothetical protein [unclassified Mesorhizobium]|uniref:hypothetical protein n=1 Tax=unclassified Mesorhizobium TaxID=325217 RepID=UPI001093AD78|nr:MULTISPECIES: hypothetical protein [unclassified Mesorhizobium]TGV22169.1 hypothetical protein EN786_31065 [Mesorhizobium sp. M4B.F.Ca.ET.143.01.1.1]
MVSQPIPIHVFRARQFAKSETVVTEGLEAAFGGSAYYRDEATEEAYLAVWGARNGSRFRRQLGESGATLQTVTGEPPSRLVWYNSGQKGHRPSVSQPFTTLAQCILQTVGFIGTASKFHNIDYAPFTSKTLVFLNKFMR